MMQHQKCWDLYYQREENIRQAIDKIRVIGPRGRGAISNNILQFVKLGKQITQNISVLFYALAFKARKLFESFLFIWLIINCNLFLKAFIASTARVMVLFIYLFKGYWLLIRIQNFN